MECRERVTLFLLKVKLQHRYLQLWSQQSLILGRVGVGVDVPRAGERRQDDRLVFI